MTDPKTTSDSASTAGLSESERMAKIRELLVGPALADETARVDQSFDRMNRLVQEQQELIATLRAQLNRLEDRQKSDMQRMQIRLLGMIEALMANEDDLRSRLAQDDLLTRKLDDIFGND